MHSLLYNLEDTPIAAANTAGTTQDAVTVYPLSLVSLKERGKVLDTFKIKHRRNRYAGRVGCFS